MMVILNKRGEGYMDLAIKLVISVILCGLASWGVMTTLNDIYLTENVITLEKSYNYANDKDTYKGKIIDGETIEDAWEVSGNSIIKYKGPISKGKTITIPSEIDGVPIKQIGNGNQIFEEYRTNYSDPIFSGMDINIVISDGIEIVSGFNNVAINNLTMANSVTKLSPGAFYECTINVLQLSNRLTVIDDYALYNCNIGNIIQLPATVNYIGSYGCAGIKIKNLTLSSATVLKQYAFANTTFYSNLFITGSGTTIESRAFYNTKGSGYVYILSSIYFPSNTFEGSTLYVEKI